jgi:CheY-like chemotaxis protein
MTSKLTRRTSPWPKSGRCSARAAVVLLVQPERDDRDMYAEYLSHMGLTPICVQDADAALRLACHADIIVTELLLPGALDGYELIHRLKHSARTGNIPIVVLTVCAWTAEQARARVLVATRFYRSRACHMHYGKCVAGCGPPIKAPRERSD